MNHNVTDSHFNKRQTEIRFQHGLCAGPLPLRLMFVTAAEKWLQKACWKPPRVYSSCVTSPPRCRCVNVHADVDQSSMAEADFMKQHGRRVRDRREIQEIKYVWVLRNLWTDLTPLTADLCPDKNNMSCILANSFLGLFSLPWRLYLSSQGDGIHQIREALKILAERVLILETMIGIHGE